ncbi:DUF6585 family protein [Streptomyces sp. NPDC048595]|uniref:DUF6585 family protein n=1 Tax=Streptomyces sp. NPDC048595 TaxID=3365576 RepID=UPI00371537E4
MTGPTPRTRGEELLLARISAAAGRAHIGRRRATYAGAGQPAPARPGPLRTIRRLLAFVRYGRSAATKARAEARLDLYEHGMTIALKGRIHVIRYDTTSVFHTSIRPPHDPAGAGALGVHTLTDIEGKRVVLYDGPVHGAEELWAPEVRQAVLRAQLPRALAALDQGERLTFGDIWLTREEVGSAEIAARWLQVRSLEVEHGAVRLDMDGTWHTLAATASTIRNLFVLRALVEHLRSDGGR